MFRRHPQADAQRQIGCAIRRAVDLFKLFHRIERKGPDAVLEISLGNRFLSLDRVHEAKRCVRQRPRDEAHLGNRGNVVMRYAAIPQDRQQIRRRVRFYRIDRAARKLLDEEAGGTRSGVRAKKRNRLDRLRLYNSYGIGGDALGRC